MHGVMTAAVIADDPTRNRPRRGVPGRSDPVTADRPGRPDTPIRWSSVAVPGSAPRRGTAERSAVMTAHTCSSASPTLDAAQGGWAATAGV